MAEYIERERLITDIHISKHNNPHSIGIVARTHNHEHQHFLSMVMAQPAADVVEVVRCKECEYNVANREIDPLDATDYSGRDIVCSFFMTDGMHPDDYCSRGKKKKGVK